MTRREGVATLAEAGDPVTLAGLSQLLSHSDEVRVVANAELAEAAVIAVPTIDEESCAWVKDLRKTHGLAVVVVIDHAAEDALLHLAELGVSGLIMRRDATARAMTDAVVAASEGGAIIASDVLGRLLHAMERVGGGGAGFTRGSMAGLSSREAEVIRLLADGYDTEQVAESLHYSPRTIKNIVHDVTVRLNVRNRAHLVAYAMRHGLL